MKRNVLNAAIAAGLFAVAGTGGSAKAVELSPDGTGQVLIYPYYTVNRQQTTLITVVNGTNVAKAVRVRFLEGYNAREVLDFNLFLSEYDVWTATVFALTDAGQAGDGAAVTTTDRSCTAPHKDVWSGALGTGRPYQEFLSFGYIGPHQDTGPTGIARTREGYVEIVQMADLSGALSTAVTHASGTPRNCGAVQTIDPANPQLLPPTGGLFGAGGIVNVAQGTFYTYNADAIGGFSKAVLYEDPAAPTSTPSLAQANTAPGVATAYVFDAAGEQFRSDYPVSGQPSRAIDAVSAVFMASTLLNEYNVDSAVGSNTDWVVTFPTKRFYVDPEILGVALGSAGALPPFTFTFGQPSTVNGFSVNGDGRSCSQVAFLPFDRESGRPTGNPPGFPGTPTPIPVLCTSVNVISMGNSSTPPVESAVLGSRLHTNLRPFSSSGWLRLTLETTAQPHALRASSDGDVYSGLPATGFQAVNYVNANLTPGVLSNYSGAFRHRAVRACANAVSGSCP
ncbi:hypothetical protein DFR29_106175 [Tahibacter aquaticus]|uniref:Uncharacterized protein n=1 Tax=Tahibacter aquaticus TaxID=520092 RepID=A0A4R6YYS3_9GAMM|nr:hypothetical protein [Tahibacter aquaticus]TDR44028.1 hypothetical protein DFR29_106175 [Tahibacter aquaticus]